MSRAESAADEVECPTCGRDDFASERGMKIHHKSEHGESIAGVQSVCENCEKTFRAEATNKGVYCSRSCANKDRDLSGESNPNYSAPIETECDWCGSSLLRIKSRIEAYDRQFCDKHCHGQWRSEHVRGELHPNWEGGPTTVECENCGNPTNKARVFVRQYEHQFCSRECHHEFLETITGEAHPLWDGGRLKFGPNWPTQRQRARMRDQFRCQDCGMAESEHLDKYGREIEVHHITPRRQFVDESGEFNHQAANALQNLVTLCRACHRKWEQLAPLAPET